MVTFFGQNREILGLVILLGASLITTIALHWTVVCPCLYRRGARFPTGLFFWRVFPELRQYRDLTSAAGKPLTFFYTGFILIWFTLLLAVALGVRVLWLQSQVGNY
jgi:hypothetical protein